MLVGLRPDATALYRFPLLGYFALPVAAAALGNARGALDDSWRTAQAGEPARVEQRAALRLAATHATRTAASATRTP